MRLAPWQKLVPFALALAVYLGAYAAMRPIPAGDEPHYLLAAGSLAFDGDLDLANDYASRERTLRVYHSFPLNLHAARYTPTSGLRTKHGIALSVLLAPAAAVESVRLARLILILIAAILAQQLYALLGDLGLRRQPWRWLAWAAVALCPPLLIFSNQVYPEVPAALLTVVALRVLVRRAVSSAALLLAALAAGTLPWLHVRYAPISGALFLGLVYAAVRARRTAAVAAVTIPALAALGFLALLFWRWYGSVAPGAPYRPFTSHGVGTPGGVAPRWSGAIVGDLFNPGFGWLPYAPAQWLGLAGIGCAIRAWGWRATAAVAPLLVYTLAVASVGVTIGAQFPARLLVAVTPLVVVPLALVLERVPPARIVFFPLFALSLVIAASAAHDSRHLYPDRVDPSRARIFPVRDFAFALPELRLDPPDSSFVLRPGGLFPPRSGHLRNGRIVASAAAGDARGFLLFGPYSPLPQGRYEAAFSVAVRPDRRGGPVARLEVTAPPAHVLARRTLAHPLAGTVVLPFATSGELAVETRVYFYGGGTVNAGPVRVTPVPGTVHRPGRAEQPSALWWLAATAAAGVILALAMKPALLPRLGRKDVEEGSDHKER